jgi:hypothetical protein
MSTFVLILVTSLTLTPIVQTYNAGDCESARRTLGRVFHGELVCIPGVIAVPMEPTR